MRKIGFEILKITIVALVVFGVIFGTMWVMVRVGLVDENFVKYEALRSVKQDATPEHDYSTFLAQGSGSTVYLMVPNGVGPHFSTIDLSFGAEGVYVFNWKYTFFFMDNFQKGFYLIWRR